MDKRTSRLRVLHLASWYPSDAHRTLGNFVQRHVESLSERTDAEVWYVAQGAKRTTVRRIRGVKERIVYAPKFGPWFLTVTWQLLRLARNADRPDLIHLHVLHPAGFAASWLARRWKVPLVVTEHWTVYHADQRAKLPHWRKALIRWVGRSVDRMCPVTDQLGASLLDFGIQANQTTVYNVVDTELFRIREITSPPTVLHISSLVDEQKNITGLIHAFAACLHQLPLETKLNIIGDGDPAPHAATAAALGLEDRITCSGEIPLDEVAERMGSASALVLFSRYENFPCVIPESWSAGTPVVATDVGGIAEHLPLFGALDSGPFRGSCVPSEDGLGFGHALLEALAAPIEREAVRAYAEQHFSVAAVADAYVQVYEELIDG